MTRIRKLFLLVLLLAAFVLAAGFAWLNPNSVALDLGVAVVETRIAYAFIACFVLGWLLGLLAALGWVVRLAGQGRRQKKAARLAEAEADSLRKLSIADDG
jgi:uncharacterized membrane protein YciS (DUF1049 family)